MHFQFFLPDWWRVIPQIKVYPKDEYEPRELVVCFSIFQFRKYLKG